MTTYASWPSQAQITLEYAASDHVEEVVAGEPDGFADLERSTRKHLPESMAEFDEAHGSPYEAAPSGVTQRR